MMCICVYSGGGNGGGGGSGGFFLYRIEMYTVRLKENSKLVVTAYDVPKLPFSLQTYCCHYCYYY